MGVYLSTPKTEKFSDDGENGRLKYGLSAMQGWRSSMEDAHAAVLDLDQNTSLFGVYDGHGGKDVSRFCAKHLHTQVLRNEAFSKGDLGQSLQIAFLRMDEMMRGHRGWKELSILNGDKRAKINHFIGGLVSPRSSENRASPKGAESKFLRGSEDKGLGGTKEVDDDEWEVEKGSHSDYAGPTSGSTAVVALCQNDKIVVANAGDSRCVLARGGKALDLSTDHKPFLEAERDRIMQAGGVIYAGRVNGTLNLARAIGDVEFKQNKHLSPEKQIVTAWPDIQIVERTEEDEFLVLACDGIWDCMTSQNVVDFIHEHINESSSISAVCEKILDNCLAPTTTLGEGCDNMTIIIVQLKDLRK